MHEALDTVLRLFTILFSSPEWSGLFLAGIGVMAFILAVGARDFNKGNLFAGVHLFCQLVSFIVLLFVVFYIAARIVHLPGEIGP